MKKLILAAIAILGLGFEAQAQLVNSFKKLDTNRKGPFSINYLQASRSRVIVTDGNASGDFQFQAAFRNEIGRELEQNYGFYTANLFTTNYYELMGEYVYGDAYGSHPIDHQALLSKAPQAIAKASSMVRNWVLEKHYVTTFPESAISRGFKLRGISGSEFEQVYARYFFNFYLSAINEDFQFLPAYLLTKGSPIAESASLERARVQIAAAYEDAKNYYGDHPGVKRLYQLRNAIHNQLSQAIIAQIDTFSREYPDFAADQRIGQVREILVAYYSVGPKRISDIAKKYGSAEIQNAADAIIKNGINVERAFVLSQAVTNLRAALMTPGAIAYESKSDAMLLLFTTVQYLNKEVGAMPVVSSKDVIKTVINLLYSEGYLIRDNWQYFISEIDGASDVVAAGNQLPDIVGVANDTLMQAFKPSLDQWISVAPKMNSFVDNAIKSSSLNTASLIIKKIKR